jgi:hypothetical protein
MVNKSPKSIDVKYYPPISSSSKCSIEDSHEWISLDYITWRLASGKHEVYWKNCTKCNTKMLREEVFD